MGMVVLRAVVRLANVIVVELLYSSVYLVVRVEVLMMFVGGFAGLLVVMVAY